MAVEHCDYCDVFVDMDYNVEHFPEAYWETEGPDHGKCESELEDDIKYRNKENENN